MPAIRTIAALLLLLAPLGAQRRDTRLAQIGDEISSAPTTLTLTSSNLIGQTQHTVTVLLTDAPSQTCIGGFVSMAIQGSYDNSNWLTIGQPLSNIQADQYGNYIGKAQADDAYPRVRFVITSFDTTKCRATVYYSGTLSPVARPSPTLFYPIYEIPAGTDSNETSMVVATAGYSRHSAYVDYGGCTTASVTFKLQAAWEAAGPWVDISDDISNDDAQTDLSGNVAIAHGEYPLVRAYIHLYSISSCTGDNAKIYYWGSNSPPDPFRRFALGTRQSLVFVQSDRSTAGTDQLKVAEADRYIEVLFLSLIVPCSGVTGAVISGSQDLVAAQQGPFSVVWPLTGHAYYTGSLNNALNFTTTGTGCSANVAMQYRLIDTP